MAWSDLLPEILAIIVREFDYAGDLVRFACVCTSWRVVAMDWRCYVSPQLPVRVSVFPGLSQISSYDPLIDRVAMLDYPSGLDGEIIGSGSGWIVVLRPRHAEVYLLSPFLGMELDLPSLHHYEDDVFWMVEGHILDDPDPDPADAYQYDCGLVHKVVVVHMSRAPGGFGAIAIYNGSARLAYAKPGDESWTAIGVHRSRYRDAVLYEGQLYAIDGFGFIRIYDFVGGIERAVVDIRQYIFGGPDFFTAALRYKFYIVPTSTDVYVVAREFSDRVTTSFTIYRMDIEARGIVRVEQIGDHAFFVGGTTLSTSIRTRDFIGLAHSGIWYTADYPYSIRPDIPYDVGVYDVELGTFQRVPMFSQLENRDYVMPPVWITRFPW